MDNLPEYAQPNELPVFDNIKPLGADIQPIPLLTPNNPNTSTNNVGKQFMDWVNNGEGSNDVKYANKTYDFDRVNADRYIQSDSYKSTGFTPDADNESIYGYKQSWGNTLNNAVKGAWGLGSTGFIDGWKGWGRMYDAVVNTDWTKLAGDSDSLADLNKKQNDIMNKYAIFSTPESDSTFWNRKTFGNFLQQSGFTLGTLAQTITEQALTKVLETATFGALGAFEGIEDVKSADAVGKVVSGWSKLGKVGEKVESGINSIKDYTGLNKVDNYWSNINAAKEMANQGSVLYKDDNLVNSFLKSAINHVPGVDIFKDMNAARNIGADWWTTGMIGIGGIKRGLSEANLSLTEARMEAAGTYGQLYNQLLYEYNDSHGGKQPSTDELSKISNMAYEAGKSNFVFNSGLLSAMNRLQFENLFKSFKAASRLSTILPNEVEEGAVDNILNVTGKIGDKEATLPYNKGKLGAMSNYSDIKADFGKSTAVKEAFVKPILGHLAKWEVAEGVQEILQNGSNDYYTDYYYDLYSGKTPDSNKSLSKAWNQEYSEEGLKTFMSGALMGLITSPITHVVEKGTELASHFGQSKDERIQINQYKTDNANNVNDQRNFQKDVIKNGILRDPSTQLSEVNKGFNIQKAISDGMVDTVINKDKFGYENFKDTSLGNILGRSVRMGTHEALIDTLESYGTSFTKEQFEQAFQGLDYTSGNKKSAQDYVGGIVQASKDYVKTWEHLQDKYGKTVNPNMFRKGSTAYSEAMFKKGAIDQVIETLAGNKHLAESSYNRMNDILSSVSNNKAIGTSLNDTFTILGSNNKTKDEISVLKQEITSLKDSTDRLSKESLKQKQQQVESLQSWLDSNNNNDTHGSVIAYEKYLNSKNQEHHISSIVTASDINDSHDKLLDYIKLNKQSEKYVDAYNLLINPKNFNKLSNRLNIGAHLAAYKIQANAINDVSNNKKGFLESNKDLFTELDKLAKNEDGIDRTEWSTEDSKRYYQLHQELANRAANYNEADYIKQKEEESKNPKLEEVQTDNKDEKADIVNNSDSKKDSPTTENYIDKIKFIKTNENLDKIEQEIVDKISDINNPLFSSASILDKEIQNKKEELKKIINFDNLKPYSIIKYNDNIFQVTSVNKERSTLTMKQYPEGAQSEITISKRDFNEHTTHVELNGNIIMTKLNEQQPITKEDVKKADESKEVGKSFFENTDELKRIKEADKNIPDANIESDFLNSLGCE